MLYKEDELIISQRKFFLDMLKTYGVANLRNCTSPLDPTIKLHAKEGTPLSDPIPFSTDNSLES